MPTNNSWQNQGRQQHGWFGTGTSPYNVHNVNVENPTSGEITYGPLGHVPRADPITPVYPLEYLLSMGSGAIGRTVLSAALRNLGWREPSQRPDGSPPIAGNTEREQHVVPNLEVHPGKQQKHIFGTNNYKPGNSILTADAKELVAEFAGHGEQRGPKPIGQPGSVEIFDTGDKIIGIWKDLNGNVAETTRGTIRYSKEGVHVIPAEPRPK